MIQRRTGSAFALLFVVVSLVSRADVRAADAVPSIAIVDASSSAGAVVHVAWNGQLRDAKVPRSDAPLVRVDLPSPAFAPTGAALAVAASEGVIATYDPAAQMLRIARPGIVTNISKVTLDGASEIAVDGDSGTVALIASSSGAATVWRAAATKAGLDYPPRTVRLPANMSGAVFDGDDLLFLDRSGDVLSAIGFGRRPETVDIKPVLTNQQRRLIGTIGAFTVHRGVVYLTTDPGGLVAVTRITGEMTMISKTPFGIDAMAGVRPVALAASDAWLACASADGSVRLIDRPTQVAFSIEGATIRDRETAVVELFRFLSRRRVLPVTIVRNDTPDLTWAAVASLTLLTSQIRTTSTLVHDMASFLASLVGVQPGDRVEQSGIPLKTDVQVPMLTVTESPRWRAVPLKGDTVGGILAKNNIDLTRDQDRKSYGDQLLQQNPPVHGTLVSLLHDANWWPAKADQPLEIGDVVAVKGDGVQRVGNLKACGTSLAPKDEPVSLGPYVDTIKQDGVLPEKVVFPRNDATKVRWYIEGAMQHRVEQDALSQYQNCKLLDDPNRYIVNETVTAGPSVVQFVDAAGKPKSIAADQALQLKTLGERASDAAVRTNRGWALGYKLTKLTTGLTAVPDPRLDRKSELDELVGRTVEPVTLPIPVWRVTTIVPRQASERWAKDLEQLSSDYKISPFSQERIISTPAMDDDDDFSDSPPPDEETLKANRRWLRKAIKFPPASLFPQSLGTVKIGLAEHANSFASHVDLKDLHLNFTGSRPPDCKPNPDEGDLYDSDSDLTRCDHATFIAGLLAARGTNAPGLLQKATIVGIAMADNNEGPEEVVRRIQAAIDYKCFIINFSQVLEGASWIQEIGAKMLSDWNQVLFVAPANKTNHVAADGTPRPLLNFEDKPAGFDHIIGVAPITKDSGTVPNEYNTSASFVQLAAPGDEIWGAVGISGYQKGKGSSLAVPLVTAAAAMIDPTGLIKRAELKARLIYTADPRTDQLQKPDSFWGGYLNVRRAVRTQEHLVVIPGMPEVEFAVDPACDFQLATNCQLTISNLTDAPHRADVAKLAYSETIRFDNILRITRLAPSGPTSDTTYRVVFIKDGQMRIAFARHLEGTFVYSPTTGFDTEKEEFVGKVRKAQVSHEWSELADYTAPISNAAGVKF